MKLLLLLLLLLLFNEQLVNEAEYLKKSYGDWGGCYDSTLRDLHNSSYDQKPNTIIILLFIQNNS